MRSIHDPRSVELDLWLSTLPPKPLLTMLIALQFVFPLLNANREWNARVGKAKTVVQPTEKDMKRICAEAARIAGDVKAEIKGERVA